MLFFASDEAQAVLFLLGGSVYKPKQARLCKLVLTIFDAGVYPPPPPGQKDSCFGWVPILSAVCYSPCNCHSCSNAVTCAALQVSNCSAGVTNPVAQQSSIASQAVTRFTFDIYTTTNLATDSSCTVGLVNSLVCCMFSTPASAL